MIEQYTKEEVLGKIKEIAEIMDKYDIDISANSTTSEIELYSRWTGDVNTGMTSIDGEDLRDVVEESIV